MEPFFNLQRRFCVEWNTRIPPYNAPVKTAIFNFQKFQWKIMLIRCFRHYSDLNSYILQLYVTPCVSQHRRFRIITLLERNDNEEEPIVCSVRLIRDTSQVSLWEFTEDDLSRIVQGYRHSDHFKIVCILECDLTCPPVPQYNKKTIHMSESPESFDLPANLESLSTDLSKLLEDNDHPDVKLKCEDQAISAHRAVLAARSEVFAAMFRNKMVESETGVIDITDMNTRVLKLFLRYVYTGQIQGLSDDLALSLYEASDKYAVHSLKKACSDGMIEGLTEGNCVSFLTAADAHSDADFKDAVVSYICGHEHILQSDVWLSFSEKHLKLANEVYQSFFRPKGRVNKDSNP